MAPVLRLASGLVLTCALVSPAAADKDRARWLDQLEAAAVSSQTAPAGLALGTAWLRDGEWLAASEALQEALEIALELEDGATAATAGQLLSAIHRLQLRPLAGGGRWQTARILEPRGLTLKKPTGVAAREGGELIVVDEALDLVCVIGPDGEVDQRWSVSRAEKPSWGESGAVRVETRGGPRELRPGYRPPAPDSEVPAAARADQVLDAARDADGGWWVLQRDAEVVRYPRDGAPAAALPLPGMRRPAALAVGPLGNVYVLDRAEKRVLVIDPAGELLTTLGPRLPGGLELGRPLDVAVDRSGRLFLADATRGIVILE